VGNQFKLWPQTIAGEKVNLIILDDASDPGKGVSNARRFVTEDKVDMIFGGSITTVSAAMAPVAAEAKTTQIAHRAGGRAADQDAGCSACRRASR
jgi:branched-chain amino acid transport system substrate-binding protein